MKTASRTLLQSPPELWELIDQPSRMHGLICALVGRTTGVTVNQREPESVLCWEAAGDGEHAWIKVELAEKGWGTHVEVSAESQTEPIRLEGWLDAVLDELATPQKRPFEGMSKTPQAETPLAEAVSAETPPAEPSPAERSQAEAAPADPAPVEAAPVEAAPDTAPAEATPAETASTTPPPRKKRRRFLGI